MRYALIILALFAGCKSVEVVEVTLDYPLAAVHVAAKFEARERPASPSARVARDADLLRK